MPGPVLMSPLIPSCFPFCLWPHPLVAFRFLNLGVSQGVAVPPTPILALACRPQAWLPSFSAFTSCSGPRGIGDLSRHFARELDPLGG